MKLLISLSRWATLLILTALFIAAFSWEENLNLSSTNHDLLAIAILVSFFWLVCQWIRHHESNFLVSKDFEIKKEEFRQEHK